jgi:hypothetical protein
VQSPTFLQPAAPASLADAAQASEHVHTHIVRTDGAENHMDSFGTASQLRVGDRTYKIHRLDALKRHGFAVLAGSLIQRQPNPNGNAINLHGLRSRAVIRKAEVGRRGDTSAGEGIFLRSMLVRIPISHRLNASDIAVTGQTPKTPRSHRTE